MDSPFKNFARRLFGLNQPRRVKGNVDLLNYRSNTANTGIQWNADAIGSADASMRYLLRQNIDKSRKLEFSNPYAERFLHEGEANVLGSEGFTLQMQIKQETPFTLADGTVIPAGAPDKGANDGIEDGWYEYWQQRGFCDVSGELSGHDIEKLSLRTTMRDGMPIVRIIRGFDNPWKFALQLMEIDVLDLDYNDVLPNGREVRMSIEVDQWGRRCAAWIARYQPGDWQRVSAGSYGTRGVRIRIPFEGFQTAQDDPNRGTLIAPFLRKRPGQTVGWPWLTPVIDSLNSINKYSEAELAAARASAEKMGWFTKDADAEAAYGEQTSDGNFSMDSAPGSIGALPVGWKFEGWDPKHPNGNFGDFRKNIMREVAAGVGMSYGAMANDRSDSSFSAERTALMDEREQYKMVQRWFADQFLRPVFSAWLEMALLQGKLKLRNGSTLPAAKYDKFNKPYFQGRRWSWINPQQDINAAILAVQHGFTSRKAVVAEGGGYIDDVDRENAESQASAAVAKVEYGVLSRPKAPDAANPDADNKDAALIPAKSAKFNEDEPRDEHGRWTDGGTSSSQTWQDHEYESPEYEAQREQIDSAMQSIAKEHGLTHSPNTGAYFTKIPIEGPGKREGVVSMRRVSTGIQVSGSINYTDRSGFRTNAGENAIHVFLNKLDAEKEVSSHIAHYSSL